LFNFYLFSQQRGFNSAEHKKKMMGWRRVLKSLQALAAHSLLFSFTLFLVLKLDHVASYSWWSVFFFGWIHLWILNFTEIGSSLDSRNLSNLWVFFRVIFCLRNLNCIHGSLVENDFTLSKSQPLFCEESLFFCFLFFLKKERTFSCILRLVLQTRANFCFFKVLLSFRCVFQGITERQRMKSRNSILYPRPCYCWCRCLFLTQIEMLQLMRQWNLFGCYFKLQSRVYEYRTFLSISFGNWSILME
jgi:hypothetical protein